MPKEMPNPTPISSSSARPGSARDRIVEAATELFRRQGYITATVEQICEAAGVTKGAFFHHFASKEDLAVACLEAWDARGASMETSAPFHDAADPLDRLHGLTETFIRFFSRPGILKSCLAGVALQEVSETHPRIRDAAQCCFKNAIGRFQATLDEACRIHGRELDTAALASLWMATLQGSLLLSKGEGDGTLIPRNLRLVQQYILSQFDSK